MYDIHFNYLVVITISAFLLMNKFPRWNTL